MNELKNFRKIVEWMLESKDTNEIVKLVDVSLSHFGNLMNGGAKLDEYHVTVKSRVQAFNKNYFADCLQAREIETYDDDGPVSAPREEPNAIPVAKDAIIQSQAVNESKTKALSDERKKQRTQEKLFHDKILQLGDFCPDHMTFDISLKRK